MPVLPKGEVKYRFSQWTKCKKKKLNKDTNEDGLS